MASTSQTESACAELLACILAGEAFPDALLGRALEEQGGRSFFSVVVERLGDLFEPRLCEEYVALFTRVLARLRPDLDAFELRRRYERVRRPKRCVRRSVRDIFVLSRVTLGADVAVTSVILDAMRRRFPEAVLHFVGSEKNWALFAESGVRHVPFEYPRGGTLAQRLSVVPRFSSPDSIVVDPDSRLSQLGILPVCEEDDYFFFESRAYGCDSYDPLPVLASRWTSEVFGVEGTSWIAPTAAPMPSAVAVSFGVGENEDKRIADPFEYELLRSVTDRGLSVVVDSGAGGREAERIEALQSSIPGLRIFRGPYAPFASMISQAKLYIGYDSAGQHVAAACGIPLVSVFAGFPSDRMFQRWRPFGRGRSEVLQVRERNSAALVAQASSAIDRLMFQHGGK